LNQPRGDNTIPNFLRGRRPEDSPELYNRISPFYHADKISTPLILTVGEKDTRLDDHQRFYAALKSAGAPETLVVYPGQGHEILDPQMLEEHFNRALAFFKEHSGRANDADRATRATTIVRSTVWHRSLWSRLSCSNCRITHITSRDHRKRSSLLATDLPNGNNSIGRGV